MRTLLFVLLCLVSASSLATTAERLPPLPFKPNVHDTASLQRGARLFVNYCLSCHAASAMRYNRLARDLRLPEAVVEENLMFNTDKLVDTMQVVMDHEDARRWFGAPPPDLSLIGRARGPRWLYAYLQGFYRDPSRPTGVNNRYFKDVAMPHVLWELQGWQEAEFKQEKAADGHEVRHLEELKLVAPGKLNPQEYEAAVRDLVNFLVYLAEPARQIRERLGVWVLLFLGVMTALFWLLKLEYWKDVH